jgi:DNA-directed RNA polymerase subunit RPC12/RpoP
MKVQVTCHECGKKFPLESEVVQQGLTMVIHLAGSAKARQVTCPHCGASNMVSAPDGMIKTDPGTITRLEP